MTPFQEIIKLMLARMEADSDLINMDTDLKLDMFSDLLLIASNMDFANCTKDLSKVEPYNDFRINRVAMDNLGSIKIAVNDIEASFEGIIVLVNDKEVEFNYSIDDEFLSIECKYSEGDLVEIVFYTDGFFHEKLSYREKSILALATYLHYMNQNITREQHIRLQISDRDYAVSSNYKTLNSLLSLKESIVTELEKHIHDYIYEVVLDPEMLL